MQGTSLMQLIDKQAATKATFVSLVTALNQLATKYQIYSIDPT
jgi:hypothetical protein